MAPRSRDAIADALGAVLDELRAQRGAIAELQRRLGQLYDVAAETASAVGVLAAAKPRTDAALTELELRVYRLEQARANGATT